MNKILVMVFAMLFAGIVPSAGEAEFKSVLSGNDFISRIRYSSDKMRLSLSCFLEQGRLVNFEAAFMSPLFSAGQIELKGLPRELSNPDGIIPGSSVLIENSGLRVTDSISGTSRTGFIFEPQCGNGIWMYRTNSGNYCSGILLNSPAVNIPFPDRADAELMLGAGTVPAEGGSSWFADCPRLPKQLVFNGAAELRAAFGAGGSSEELCRGRRMLKPDVNFNTAVSLLGGISFPEYTAPAGLCRLLFVTGNKALNLSGICQYAGCGYLPPEGPSADYGLSAGAQISADFKQTAPRHPAGFNCSAGYFFQREHPEVLPARLIGQNQTVDAGIEIIAGIFTLDICSELEISHLTSGAGKTELSADAVFTADMNWAVLGLDGGITLEDSGGYSSGYSYDLGVNCKVFPGSCRIEADWSFSDLQHILKAGFCYRSTAYSVKTSIEITGGRIGGLTAGFES